MEATIRFMSVFLPVWNQWFCVSTYLNRWETHDVMNILFFIGNIILMSLVGVSARECDVDAKYGNNEEECSLRTMNFLFAGARMWVLLFEMIVAYYNWGKAYMAIMIYFMTFDAMVVVSWLVAGSIVQSDSCDESNMSQGCYYSFVFFWWLGIGLDIVKIMGNAISAKFGLFSRLQGIPINVALAAERQELFIVISIGELMAAALNHADFEGEANSYALTSLAVLMAALIKIRYFDFAVHPTASGNETTTRSHAMRTAPLRGMGYVLCHIPLNASIVMLGANMDVILSEREGVHSEVLVAACNCVAVIIFTCSTIDLLHSNGDSKAANKPTVAIVNGVFIVLALMLHNIKDFSHDSLSYLGYLSIILLGNVCGTHQMSQSRIKVKKCTKVTKAFDSSLSAQSVNSEEPTAQS